MHIIDKFYEIHHQNTVTAQKENCPMNGACLSLVYYATINCNDKNYKPKLYKGSCETSFKKFYSNRKKSFNTYNCTQTNMTPSHQQNIGVKNEATEPTDILEIKRNI